MSSAYYHQQERERQQRDRDAVQKAIAVAAIVSAAALWKQTNAIEQQRDKTSDWHSTHDYTPLEASHDYTPLEASPRTPGTIIAYMIASVIAFVLFVSVVYVGILVFSKPHKTTTTEPTYQELYERAQEVQAENKALIKYDEHVITDIKAMLPHDMTPAQRAELLEQLTAREQSLAENESNLKDVEQTITEEIKPHLETDE